MSKKLVLLPMDLYKGLLQTQGDNNEDLAEHAPLQYEKAQLKKIRRKKLKNLSTKNVLYNQQLRRYLRTRKEAKDRPIKLKLAEGDVKLLKAAQEPKLAAIDDKGDLQSVSVEERVPSVRFSEDDDNVFVSPRTSKSSLSPRTSASSVSTRTSAASVNTIKPSPVMQLRRHTHQESEKKNRAELKASTLLKKIMTSPRKFGVSDEGEILNPHTQRPIKNSNLKWAVNRLVNPTTQNAPSPAGFTFLKKAILNDPEVRGFVFEGYQSGKGKKVLKQHNFRPSKWKK